MKTDTAYDLIKKFVRSYRKSREELEELISMCWLEFTEGPYVKILDDPPALAEQMKIWHERGQRLQQSKFERRIKAHEVENKLRQEQGLEPFPVPKPYKTKPFKMHTHEQFQEYFMRKFVKVRALRQMTLQQQGDYRTGVEIDIAIFPILTTSPEEEMLSLEHEHILEGARHELIAALPLREKKVLVMLVQGLNRREIAIRAHVSLGTVQNIVERLRKTPEVTRIKQLHLGGV